MTNTSFKETFHKEREQLDLYTTAITRAHGDSHPEAHDVRKLFETMVEKIDHEQTADLTDTFFELKKVTNDYTIPADVCETYATVYRTLATLNEIYEEK